MSKHTTAWIKKTTADLVRAEQRRDRRPSMSNMFEALILEALAHRRAGGQKPVDLSQPDPDEKKKEGRTMKPFLRIR